MSLAIITGSTGLVGSEAVNFFHDKGFDIIGIDNNQPSAKCIFFIGGPDIYTISGSSSPIATPGDCITDGGGIGGGGCKDNFAANNLRASSSGTIPDKCFGRLGNG